MATTTLDLGRLSVGNVYRFRVTITKDGAAWNLSSGSVQIVFEKPDRSTTITQNMVAENAAGGIFYYDNAAAEIDTEGYWGLTIIVTDGTVVQRYPYEIGFHASSNP